MANLSYHSSTIRAAVGLGDFVVSNRDRLSSENAAEVRHELIFALLSGPTGKWYDALVMLAEVDSEACQALDLRHDKLQQDQQEAVQRLCGK